ncbi:hypothetical protein [Luteolibacter marinus]|uniref:hypothetical protein n=1 Tax=Luteolibacter marinus TaxID=2776705 RepID=UPI0018687293|nr:hypothetical protein [Luteolibacter marinus]
MKTLLRFLLPALLPIAIGALTGCAGMGASSTEPMLSASGFRVKKPENTTQQQLYDQLPPYKIQRGEYQGKIFYAYKDEKQGVAYVGNEDAYQQYQKLATEKSIARAQYEAAQMQQDMAYRWYGAYYPRGYYRY